MDYLVQQLINGLTLGAVYGLIAIGYTMVYGIIGMINFAHGDIYMIGAFIALIAWLLISALGLALPAALLLVLLLTIFFTSLYGWATERIAYRRLRSANRLAPLISAIGMSIFLQNSVQLLQGARVKPLQPIVTGGFSLGVVGQGGGVTISWLQLVIVSVTICLMIGVNMIIKKTALGRAQRACEQDKLMASLCGVDVNRTISVTFMMGAGLAAAAGFMVMLYYGVVDFYMGFLAGMKAFTAAVLGGIGSLPGAMLGGFLIGLIEALWSGYISVQYKDVAAFAMLILVLLMRPYGLFGRPDVEKI